MRRWIETRWPAFLPCILVPAIAGLIPLAAAPAAAAEEVRFVNIAADAGLILRNYSGDVDKTTIDSTVGNGICLHDFDDDGSIDIFVPNGLPDTPRRDAAAARSALYRNRGDGTFEDVTAKAGVGAEGYWAQGCVFADYDGDGRVDLFITGFGGYILFRNLGEGRFRDVASAAGLEARGWSTGAAFADYDGDGRIDLYVSHYVDHDADNPPLPKPGSARNCFYRGAPVMCGPRGLAHGAGRLFHNEGGGRFRDVTTRAGLGRSSKGYGLGTIWTDLDGDGDVDLYVANDSTANYLYRNDGGGRFSEVGTLAGVAFTEDGRSQAGMGVDSGDFDNDGRFDLLVTNFSHDYSTLYHNEGDLFFQDVSIASGVGTPTLAALGWGTGFLDYDNDGRLDFFFANGHVYPGIDRQKIGSTWKQPDQLFRNLGNGRFAEVTAQAGPAFAEHRSSRGAAFADLDNDGDIDIVVNNMDEAPSLLRNDGGNRNGWIGFRLRGAPPNRGAIGASVTVIAGSLRQVRELHAGGSHNSSNDPRLLFGLGAAASVDRIEIRWPDGERQRIDNLPGGRYHDVTQAAAKKR